MARGCFVEAENAKKKWTEAEEEYLQEAWGKSSLKTIAKNLGRSEDAVIVRINRMGLPPGLQNGERISWNQFVIALCGTNHGSSYLKMRLEREGFPTHRQIIRGTNGFRFTTVDIDEFWEFAERHKELFDFSRMERYAFGFEPEWATLKRRIDTERLRNGRKNNDPWTSGDDSHLLYLLRKQCYTYTDIAHRLRRSEGAVKRRLATLGVKERPVRMENREWTQEEELRLLEMLEQGYGFDNIAQELGRTALGVRGKHECLVRRSMQEGKAVM